MKVWRYGDDVNTDMLFPGKYTYTCATAPEILPHLLEDLDPRFAKEAKRGDLVMAGSNFGCGSSREQPALGLAALGIEAVIAKSFARIFYRAAINQGLLLVECPAAVDAYIGASTDDISSDGAAVTLDARSGIVSVAGQPYRFPALPPEILAIREAGGLLEHARQKLRRARGGGER